jgi:2-methylcitrate dehydratase
MAAAAPLSIRIADFVAAMALDALPEGTRRGAGRQLLDTLGCALGALGAPPARMLEAILPPPGASPARCLGSGRATTAEGAAGGNGALARHLDVNDVYWSSDICHPSENIPSRSPASRKPAAAGAR